MSLNRTDHTSHAEKDLRSAPLIPHNGPSAPTPPPHTTKRKRVHAPFLHPPQHARHICRIPNPRTPPRAPGPDPDGTEPKNPEEIQPKPPSVPPHFQQESCTSSKAPSPAWGLSKGTAWLNPAPASPRTRIQIHIEIWQPRWHNRRKHGGPDRGTGVRR